MKNFVIGILESQGIAALLQDRVRLTELKEVKVKEVKEMQARRLALIEELRQLNTNMIDTYSEIADINELLDVNEKTYNRLLGPGARLKVVC